MSEAYIGLAGVLVGSAVSLVGVLINERFIEKREVRKEKAAREEEAIAKVYSPIMFHLEKTRDIFASIMAIKETGNSPELWTQGQIGLFVVQLNVSKKAAVHRDILQDLLMKQAGVMDSKFYGDLFLFESYLDTTCSFLDQLVICCLQEPKKVEHALHTFVPMISELDKAIANLRIYAGQRITRQKVEYSIFFDNDKNAKIECYIEAINKDLTGVKVPDWDSLLKKELLKR